MAEIPVERKTGGTGLPWWLIPLLLLALLIPLLLFLTGQCGDRAAVVDNTNTNGNGNRTVTTTATNTTTTTTNAGNGQAARNANSVVGSGNNAGNAVGNSRITTEGVGTATGESVTDVNIFGGTNDKASLVGRGVALQNVRVNSVLSDRVFTVTSGSGSMYVLLDEGLDSEGGKEQQVKMRRGQTVNINGDFRQVPSRETNQERGRDLSAREFARMRNQQVYLHAASVSDVR